MGCVQWPHRLYIIDLGLIRLVLLQWMKLRWLESITAELRGRNVEIYENIHASRCHYLLLQVSGASILSPMSAHTYIYNNCDRHPVTKSFLFLSGLVKNKSSLCYLWSFTFYFDSKPSISTIANYNMSLQWNNLSPIQLSEQRCLN